MVLTTTLFNFKDDSFTNVMEGNVNSSHGLISLLLHKHQDHQPEGESPVTIHLLVVCAPHRLVVCTPQEWIRGDQLWVMCRITKQSANVGSHQ